MNRLSSAWTVYMKRIFPTFWFGLLAVGIVGYPFASEKSPLALLLAVLFGAITLIFFRRFYFSLLDSVEDHVDHLVVAKGRFTDQVALHNIETVRKNILFSPTRVTLTLRQPCRFGSDVSFMARTSLPFTTHRSIDELIRKVDRARAA